MSIRHCRMTVRKLNNILLVYNTVKNLVDCNSIGSSLFQSGKVFTTTALLNGNARY